jgi:glucosamine kinase
VIENDGQSAYARANLTTEGIVFVGGTGSVAFRRIGDRLERPDGWGWFCADGGSASWIAKRALDVATWEYDGLRREKQLVECAESYFGKEFPAIIAMAEDSPDKRYFAELAPQVARLAQSGYGPPDDIFEASADYVAALIRSLLSGFAEPPRISLVGGTLNAGAYYTDRIRARLHRPFNMYYGYPVAAGGFLLFRRDIGDDGSFELRDRLPDQMKHRLGKKSRQILHRFRGFYSNGDG